MNGTENKQAIASAADCAEAAAWIARLHRDERTRQVEAGFRRWLAASPAHRAAFEMANEIWLGAERLPKPAAPAIVRWPRSGVVLTWSRALAAVCSIVAMTMLGWFVWREPGIATGIGEQRYLTLEDGSRVTLNTGSRIVVRFEPEQRRIELDYGEALFEVAKNPNRPFVVVVADKQVRALGTSFLVRHESSQVAVTLVEGKVSVSDTSPSQSAGPNYPASEPGPGALTLSAGQRLTFEGEAVPKLDVPQLDSVTAWQRGQVIFDHASLAEAVHEMNRYSALAIELDGPRIATLQVTGVFRVGDTADFARAVAEAYDLEVIESSKRLLLVDAP